MESIYPEGKTFTKKDFTKHGLAAGEYESCKFINCDFANSNLSEIRFIDCTFENCNLSMVKLNGTAFRDATFNNCKMLGLHFENCNGFGLSMTVDGCNLNHSSFYKVKLKKTVFSNVIFHEADFTDCDLSGSVFDRCDFDRAIFDRTVLEKADLRTSFNYIIDPERNRLRKAKFSLAGAVGLLVQYDVEIE